uniref:SURF1 family cytochrome oxidase biogenesis protein n=1 Tax=uncultured Altererythrobacter sp. TaxID=500840 RepID=UPI00262F1422|nr:SURF1 family cytochrome oxidase biogenesis protein [uncultured Altererythrobacter sp.]
MNLRQLPIFPTIVVFIAAGIMVWLGFWQWGKIGYQEARLQQYEANADNPELVPFPLNPEAVDQFAYRRSSVDCRQVLREPRIVAGRNVNDQAGYVQVVTCELGNGAQADVQLGWAGGPNAVSWDGGKIVGSIEPLRTGLAKLIADPPVEGLSASAPPRKKVIDHMAYAGQWFFFALTALIIYFLAIRKKLSERREGED